MIFLKSCCCKKTKKKSITIWPKRTTLPSFTIKWSELIFTAQQKCLRTCHAHTSIGPLIKLFCCHASRINNSKQKHYQIFLHKCSICLGYSFYARSPKLRTQLSVDLSSSFFIDLTAWTMQEFRPCFGSCIGVLFSG